MLPSVKWQRFSLGPFWTRGHMYSSNVTFQIFIQKIRSREYQLLLRSICSETFQTSFSESRTKVLFELFLLILVYVIFFSMSASDILGTRTALFAYISVTWPMIGEDGVRENVNSFGDRAHLCDAANKTTHHKHARDIAKKMVAAIAFAADN